MFEPDYKLESIEEHAEYMWNNKHLKAIPKVEFDENGQEMLEIGAHRRGRKEYLKSGDTIVGNHVLVKVVKNKVAPPFKKAEFDIIYSEGISREGSVIDVALFYEILQKQGAWISYGETKIGQGREAARAYLKQNPKLLSEIEQKVKEQAAQAT